MAREDALSSNSVGPRGDRQFLLLLRLGARVSAGEAVPSGSLRRLVGARKHNARGTPLVYSPYSFRCDEDHVPRWIRHCHSVIHSRRGRQIMEEREQHFVAMGYFTLIVMRRWRKWARREAGLRRLVERLSIRAAMRSWKETVQRVNLLVLLHRLAIRDALFRWRRKVEDGVACEAADCHHSRKLASRVWEAWAIFRATAVSDRSRLSEGMKRWVSWQQRWRACVKSLHGVITRRAVASALHRWRVEATASSDRCRRQAVVGRLLGRALLRKCMLALAKNALSATRIRRLLEYFRKRSLRHALDTWRRWSPQENQERPVSPPPNERKKITNRRHQPGKPRKVHCRCVYAVCRGQRCTCAPRSHLLRRVEELHKLVAQGLGEREGGYRLLSHVVQGTAGGRRGDRYAVERDPCIGLASSRSGCNESRDSPRVCVRPGRRRSTAVEGRTKDGCANADKGSRERRLLAATRSTKRAGAATTALGVPNCSYPGVAGPEPEGFHAASLEGQADLRDTIDVLGASRQRPDGKRNPQTRPRRARAAAPRQDLTHW